MQVDRFYISRYHPTTDEATIVYWVEGGQEHSSPIVYRGSDSKVIQTGRTLMVADDVEDVALSELDDDRRPARRSAVTVPLRARGRIVGVVSVQCYRASAYTDADVETLQGTADLAAAVCENVGYVGELERKRREGENMKSIVRTLVSPLKVEEVLTVLSDTAFDGASLHAQRVGEKLRAHPKLGPLGISVSCGVASYDSAMKSVEDPIRAADRDLYRAKGERDEA